VVWPARASVATLKRVFETRSPEDQPTCCRWVRFSFEATTLRQAVDVAGELRQVNSTDVRVRPARVSRKGSFRWAILVTAPALTASAVFALEEEMRRVAWTAPGIRFTGWLYLSASVESVPPGMRAATVRAPARVLIVDDSAPFRRAAREVLEGRGYRVVGAADTAVAGFEAVERLKPDAVLLDVRLPDGSGLDLCEVLTREHDAPAILLMSSDDAAHAALAKARGARGFVPKADLARVDLSSIWG
jgi:CheY-like chemotaxis protein